MGIEKALYRRWINELWAGEPVAAELVSADFVGHWPNRDVHGPDELQVMVDETRTMLTDLRFEVEVEPFVGRDLVAARWIGTGATADGGAVHRQRHSAVRRRPVRRVLDGHLHGLAAVQRQQNGPP